MSTPIEKNTTDLQAILDAVNALPEDGGGDPVLQEKIVSPSTSVQNVTPDSGYDGLSKVTVNAMPTATQATPSISVSSTGKITASSTQTAGYVAAGSTVATMQLSTQTTKTITPSTSSQTAVAKGVYTTGAVTVAPIPSTYVKPTTKKAATTYTPGTSNQTIAAGTYCSGAQTIKGDSNLVAANIKKGVSIFGVTGTHEGGEDGGVETCTVELLSTSDSIGFYWCIAMIVEDGTVVAKNFEPSYREDPTITIQNVRCDSLIVVYFSTSAAVSRTCTNARLVNSTGTYDIYHVTAEPNSSVNISFDLLDL